MCFSGWGGKERAWEIITDDVAGFQGPKISDFGALKMTNIIILSVSRESVNYESASTIWGGEKLDPQGLIKGSPQIAISFHNSPYLACRAFKFGFYVQDINKFIVWKFLWFEP